MMNNMNDYEAKFKELNKKLEYLKFKRALILNELSDKLYCLDSDSFSILFYDIETITKQIIETNKEIVENVIINFKTK